MTHNHGSQKIKTYLEPRFISKNYSTLCLDFGPFELQSVQMTFPQQEMYQKNCVFYEHSKYVMDSAMAHSRAELVFPTGDSKWCSHWQFKWNGQNQKWNQQMTTSPT